jgi:hypothetical protein
LLKFDQKLKPDFLPPSPLHREAPLTGAALPGKGAGWMKD